MGLNETPRGDRIHIALYGRRNSGKSSLINALTGQKIALVSDVAGTTADPVYKPIELRGLGACALIDTAGFDDEGALGALRVEKTRETLDRADLALLVLSAEALADAAAPAALPSAETSASGTPQVDIPVRREAPAAPGMAGTPDTKADYSRSAGAPPEDFAPEREWLDELRARKIPTLVVAGKSDLPGSAALVARAQRALGLSAPPLAVSAATGEGVDALREALVRLLPEDFAPESLTGALVSPGDTVLLVMPQDAEAPKGRLILPQVQTIRDLLDNRCTPVCTTPEEMPRALAALAAPPALVITDSQAFAAARALCPPESRLTSFSILLAAFKGDLPAFVEGARAADALTGRSRVLIAEACTHAPLSEDIGRVKIPALLRKRYGSALRVDIVSGVDFPEDLRPYDLIVHCGGCMFNRRYVLSRVQKAQACGVPITNYGVLLAKLTGVLDEVVLPAGGC